MVISVHGYTTSNIRLGRNAMLKNFVVYAVTTHGVVGEYNTRRTVSLRIPPSQIKDHAGEGVVLDGVVGDGQRRTIKSD